METEMDTGLDLWDAIMNTAANNKNKDNHKYTIDELFEIYPLLYVANLTEFYPELERLGNRLVNLLGGN